MSLIGVATIFSISIESLFLADAYVHPSFELFRGFFALCYYPAKTALIAAIFLALHKCLRDLNSGIVSKGMRSIMYLDYFIIGIISAISVTLINFNFQYGVDAIETYFSQPRRTLDYGPHWIKLVTAYFSLILAIGVYILGFSAYLLTRPNIKKATKAVCLTPVQVRHILGL